MSRNEIEAKEFKFGWHLPRTDEHPDTHIIKEKIKYKDGTFKDNLLILTNVKRPFYTTKKIFRKYKQKKQAEFIHRLDRHETTESDLIKEAARALGIRKYNPTRRDINSSPYLYGSEIKALNLIKESYVKKYNMITKNTIMYLDIEADVETQIISVITLIHRDQQDNRIKIVTAINKQEMPTVTIFKDKIVNKFLENLPDELPDNISKDILDFEIIVCNNDVDTIKEIFKVAHKWGDDFLTGWNIEYDITVMYNTLKNNDIDPADVFADPSLPKELRKFEIQLGKKTFKKQDGSESSLDPEKQWHNYLCTSKFYIIDMMSTYYAIRVGGKEIQGGYSLQNVLDKELNLGKLKFDEITDLTSAEWHIFFLKNRPLEYVVYNIWDVLALLVLEEKNNDLGLNLPLLSGRTMYQDYGSSSKKIMDDFHFHTLEMGMVIGSFIVGEDYGEGLTRKGWTVTLQPWKLETDGYKIFKGLNIPNNINLLVYDLDAVSAYPNATILLNLSKRTTAREILSIGDIELEEFKRNNLNLCTGKIADIDYCVSMFNFPTIKELDRKFNELKNKGNNYECKSFST